MERRNMEVKLELRNLRDITNWLIDYKKTTNCKGVVLGISGGKDSAVVAMLAKSVWGDNVYGLIMPNGEQADIDDAIAIANALHIEHRIVNIGTVYNSLILNIEHRVVETAKDRDYEVNCPPITDKAKTNIPPRLRMITLYAVAQSLGYRVIGTGNASEGYVGWTTKFGDSACDFNPIAHLTCTEVIELGKMLARIHGLDEKFVTKTPSDGLCGKSDEESFGFTYEELDSYIRSTPDSKPLDLETTNKIQAMHTASEHKRRLPATLND